MDLLVAKTGLDTAASVATIAVGFVAAAGFSWGALRAAVRYHNVEEKVTRAEFQPNGGGSFRDHVDRQFEQLRLDVHAGFSAAETRSIDQQRQLNDHNGRLIDLERAR